MLALVMVLAGLLAIPVGPAAASPLTGPSSPDASDASVSAGSGATSQRDADPSARMRASRSSSGLPHPSAPASAGGRASGAGAGRPSGRASAPESPSASAAPSVPRAPAPVTDTISLFGFVCTEPGATARVVYTRNPALPEPASSCRTATTGQLTIVVADPADHTTVYDRVQTGPNGYANAIVPVGEPFVLILEPDGAPASRSDVSPVYRLNIDSALRQPMAIRLFQVGPDAGPGASPAASGSPGAAGATPTTGVTTAPVTILGLICASDGRAGIYDYLSGPVDVTAPPPGSGPCRHATVDELEFLLLDNVNPSRLYADATTGADGTATAQVPVDRPFFITEFNDDPGAETGLPGGSAAITIPADPAARPSVALTVVRNVAPDALDLPAGSVLLSTVVCPPTGGTATLTALGPAPTVLIRADGAPAGTPQPGSEPGCEEATGTYAIAPYGNDTVPPVTVSDGADDGALIVSLPATLTADGTRAFAPYRITETDSGLTTTFDVQPGAWTSLRVVLIDRPATPDPGAASAAAAGTATSDASASGGAGPPALTGTPAPAIEPTTTGAAVTPVPAAPPDGEDAGGLTSSPVRLLWAALAVLAIGIFLAGTWVLRRPGHRWRRRAG